MKLSISKEAITWFKEEMDATSGSTIKFFTKYGGSNPFHEGYSLGVTFDEPIQEAVSYTVDNIHFFIEQDDLWFFNEHDLHVSIQQDELSFEYVSPK